MKNLVLIILSGHSERFTAEQPAYDALQDYLRRAERSLQDDADRSEVIRDLEQSIGEKLKARMTSPEHVLTVADMQAVLAEVGPVGYPTGEASSTNTTLPKWQRPLVRIKESQQLLGVCTGLSAFSEIRLDWVRFLMLVIASSGIGAVVYVALGFMLPVVETRAEYEAMLRQREQAAN